MGCVLCTGISRSGRGLPSGSDRSRRIQEPQVGSDLENDVTASRLRQVNENQRLGRGVYSKNQQGWPLWLSAAVGNVIQSWPPRRASTFEKLDKIGQGTYSNVYKARDLFSGKIVALKKVRFDNLEAESVKFMAREILLLQRLHHPNVIKLEGLATSRMSCSLYLVFEYMEHDLAGLVASHGVNFTQAQVKCYMKQILLGLEHCHDNGVLHRDIKGSNLLIGDDGVLKIADFGLATSYSPGQRQPMTSRVVTLWYRAPELLLGSTFYDVGIDIWSAGCILGELLSGKPVMPGRTEVEQLHKIFKLCGSPPEEYWKKYKLPNATLFKPQQPYKRCITETFKDFPRSSVSLIETLLSLDPEERGSATSALNSEFFTLEPHACEASELPKYPPIKELDVKLREEEARRQRSINAKSSSNVGNKRGKPRERGMRAMPAPEANAEVQSNLDRWRVVTEANAKSKSEKFPPPHEDGAVGFHIDNEPASFGASQASFSSTTSTTRSSGPLRANASGRGISRRRKAAARRFFRALRPPSIGLPLDLRVR